MKASYLASAALALGLAACAAGASQQHLSALPAAPAMRPHSGSGSSGNVIKDPGFESGGFTYWGQCGSVKAKIVSNNAHSGKYSLFEGTSGNPEIKGTAAVCQTITVPQYGRLSFWTIQNTTDTLQYANQTVALLTSSGKPLYTVSQVASNTIGWQQQTFDIGAYAGQTVQLSFSVKGNGYSGAYINQYIDDVSLVTGTPTPSPKPSPTAVPGSPINHVVIVLQENRTFDNIFHGYPGANYAKTGETSDGKIIPLREVRLMTPWDPGHEYQDWRAEFNDGKMNGFNHDSIDYGSGQPNDFAYSYAKQSDVQPYWDLAKEGVLLDNAFADHRSQSFAGHLFPIAGASGPIDAADPNYYAANNPSGGENCASPGSGQAIDIITGALNKQYTTCFDFKTIADLMDAKGLSWKFYIDAASRESSYVSSFSVIRHIYNSPEFNTNVVSPETAIMEDAQNGTLPAVSYVIGTFANSDHAGQNVPSSNGPRWVTSVFNAIGKSKYWKDTVIILAYDDWGGWYDHVKPTTWDAFEPGFRLPFVIDSAYAKRGYVSHKPHYIGSILHFIEKNWNLGSLHTTDVRADAFDDVFDYAQKPLRYIPVDAGNPLGVLVDADLDWYAPPPPTPEDRD